MGGGLAMADHSEVIIVGGGAAGIGMSVVLKRLKVGNSLDCLRHRSNRNGDRESNPMNSDTSHKSNNNDHGNPRCTPYLSHTMDRQFPQEWVGHSFHHFSSDLQSSEEPEGPNLPFLDDLRKDMVP